MVISITQAAALKEEVKKRFCVSLHFCDGCGGQFFTLEAPDEALRQFITEYFADQDLQAVFSEDGLRFTVKKQH